MRVIICGSRWWTNAASIDAVVRGLAADDPGVVIIEGGARGADTLAREAADRWYLNVEEYPAHWTEFGKAAGVIRNQKMLNTGVDLVIAFHPDIEHSKGTGDMVRRARKMGVPVRLVES
jgi:hypothetical protein